MQALCERIAAEWPGARVVAAYDGYNHEDDAVMDEIAALEPDIVLVALGVPRQEKLLFSHFPKFSKGLLMGVGGSFDVLSGLKKRAPAWIRRANLEWLYRILREPSRLPRFFRSNLPFVDSSGERRRLREEGKNDAIHIIFVASRGSSVRVGDTVVTRCRRLRPSMRKWAPLRYASSAPVRKPQRWLRWSRFCVRIRVFR